MSENITPTSADQSAQDRKRKRKALLAGGLVLGLGAAATLAAFSDDVFGAGTFDTTKFNIEASQTAIDSGYAEHSTEGEAAELEFTLAPENMEPGETVYAPYFIRIDAPTTTSGTIVLSGAESNGPLANVLKYSMASNLSTCNDSADPTDGNIFNWASMSASGDVPDSITAEPLAANDAGTPGTAIATCIAVTLDATPEAISAIQATDLSTTITWQWTATANA